MDISQEDNGQSTHEQRVSGKLFCHLTLDPDIDTIFRLQQHPLLTYKDIEDPDAIYLCQEIT